MFFFIVLAPNLSIEIAAELPSSSVDKSLDMTRELMKFWIEKNSTVTEIQMLVTARSMPSV